MSSDSPLLGFFFWSTIFNLGVLFWWFVVFTVAHDWLHRLHGRWFRLTVEQFDAIHYAGMAAYKIAILLFNLAPLVALLIMR